jgi:hypothetical protein
VAVLHNRVGNVLYNFDRMIASAIWGTSQETISSEVGRIAKGAGQVDGWTPRWGFEVRWAKAVARWLDTTPKIWGVDHTSKAIAHADLLDAVDDGKEQ